MQCVHKEIVPENVPANDSKRRLHRVLLLILFFFFFEGLVFVQHQILFQHQIFFPVELSVQTRVKRVE